MNVRAIAYVRMRNDPGRGAIRPTDLPCIVFMRDEDTVSRHGLGRRVALGQAVGFARDGRIRVEINLALLGLPSRSA